MTKIVLTVAAILVATGATFAGSDHYGADNANQPVAGVDRELTASIHKHDMAKHGTVDTGTTTGPATSQSWPEPGQGIWGN